MQNIKTMITGVYAIIDRTKELYYIGSAVDILNSRKSNHMAKFKKNKFPYTDMQESYNINKSNIVIEILDTCEESELRKKEKWWKNYLSSVDGITVVNKQDIKDFTVHKKSDECKEKMSLKQRGENNPRCKLFEEDIIWIRNLYATGEKTFKQLAEIFGVSTTAISNIISNNRWKHI